MTEPIQLIDLRQAKDCKPPPEAAIARLNKGDAIELGAGRFRMRLQVRVGGKHRDVGEADRPWPGHTTP